jgi:hypothetical protein
VVIDTTNQQKEEEEREKDKILCAKVINFWVENEEGNDAKQEENSRFSSAKNNIRII